MSFLHFLLMLWCCYECCGQINQCLGRVCERENANGKKIYTACEPRNNAIEVATLAKIKVEPESATCGKPPGKFCSLRNPFACSTCDASRDDLSHEPTSMVDRIKWTWWQSRSWNNSEPNAYKVNITMTLPKKFILTNDILISFNDGYPEKMIVEKSSDYGTTWSALQYYSNNCMKDFGVHSVISNPAYKNLNEAFQPLCSGEFSSNDDWRKRGLAYVHIAKRIRALKAFGMTEENLCSSIHNDSKLHSFLEITSLRIRLLRPPVLQGSKSDFPVEVRQSSHYGIKKVHISARCQCNGHSSECVKKGDSAVCKCSHNTYGSECQLCKPLFWMRPWTPGSYFPIETPGSGNPCLSVYIEQRKKLPFNFSQQALNCECHGHSNRCEDMKQLGTACVDCMHNTEGQNCHRCKHGYYRSPNTSMSDKNTCRACACSRVGSFLSRCRKSGQCKCKENFVGRSCDECAAGYQFNKMSCERVTAKMCLSGKTCSDFCLGQASLTCRKQENQVFPNPFVSLCQPLIAEICSCKDQELFDCSSLTFDASPSTGKAPTATKTRFFTILSSFAFCVFFCWCCDFWFTCKT